MRHTFRYLVEVVPAEGATITLGDADSHHLARVVRRGPGDRVELIDGCGGLWPAVVVEPGPPATVRVDGPPRAAPPPAPVTLVMGLAEWGRIGTAVEKAAELGVARVVLMRSGRVRRAPDAEAWERRRERLLRVAEAAAKQAGRARLPLVEGLVPFGTVLDQIPEGEGFLLDPHGDVPLSAALAARGAAGAVTLVVGPDTGLSPDEVARARDRGLAACHLGPATLRAETAAIAGITLALDAVGALDPAPGAA